MSPMERLFSYGTLQDTKVQLSLIGRELDGKTAILQGYIINHLLMPPYPVAMPDDNASTEGQVFDITQEELQRLDIYEGECYLRIRVWLENGQEAWVYIGNPSCYPDI